MSSGTSADQTAAAIEARRQASAAKVQQVRAAITRLRREKALVTYAAVARRAQVSRTFLYQNAEARALVDAEAKHATARGHQEQADQDAQYEASWRERALNAEGALTLAHGEIRLQRTRMGELLGQIRDLRQEVTQGSVQQLTSANTTLKQRVRQLSEDNRGLEDKLAAARSNNRFLDKRIADLEAQLLDASGRAAPG